MNVSHGQFHLPHDQGRHLHTVSGGRPDGPTLLCLHGATGNWSNYRPLLKHFADHYRLEAVDMRGHGRSPWQAGTLEDFYQDLESYVATLPKPILLLAHSFGGYFGVRLAATHPDWFTHMVLFNTAKRLTRGISVQVLRLFCRFCDLIARPEGVIASGSVVTKYLVDNVLADWTWEPYYASIRCPVLGIAGLFDPLIPYMLARSSLKPFANHRFHTLPWGFHIAMWERPALLHRWITRFVEENAV